MRRVLRQRELVVDDWRHWGEDVAAGTCDRGIIVPLRELRANPQEWDAPAQALGVRIAPADKLEDLIPELTRFALVAIEFPSPTEGRGYSQARLLRGRVGFKGELRAVGAAVKRDLMVALARCGFDAFEVASAEDPEACLEALCRYSVAYQVDGGNELTLRWRKGSASM
jgi:uncharacterized protein (DUF934 family)